MAAVEYRLLGPVEASVGGRSLALAGRKQRAVLAMLALAANSPVSVERLIEGLWGAQPPASAAKLVQLYVSQLRRLLPEGTIVTRGRGYELRADPDTVDALRFERLATDGGGREALALWRGPALADVADEPFAAAAIRELEEQRLAVRERAIDGDLDAGRHAEVIGELETMLGEHPLRERIHARRMLALYRAGRQADALDAYRQARATLVEQIGVEPGPELRRLHEDVLAQDAGLDAPAAVAVGALPAGTVTMLFTDIEGSTRLVLEHGERGYSRLLAAHQQAVRAVLREHGGVEVGTQGDAFFLAFAAAADAITAAAALQALPADPIRIRIGIHTGEPQRLNEDYTGIDVHRAARICAAAHGGQIILSDQTRTLLHDAFELTALGDHRLKGLANPEPLYQLGHTDFPPPRSLNDAKLAPEPTPRSGPAREGPVLLERERELSELDSLLADIESGEGRLLLIEGPAGIGKTMLLRELRRRARGRGLLVLGARGGELEQDFGFGIVRQLLEPALADAGAARRGTLFAGAAGLAEPLFETALDAGDGDTSHAILHGLYWLLANLAEGSPLMLAVDDVHWADRPSVRFLVHLARRLDGLPVALAITSRSGEPADEDELQRTLRVEARPPVLRPVALSERATAGLVKDALGEAAPANLSAACHEASGGNPFLLGELLEELRSERRPAGEFSADVVRRLGPERIASALLLRLGRVDAHATALARAVAVLGTRARVDDAAVLAGLAPAAVRSLAGRLADAAVLDRGEPLGFVHPIVRTSIYQDIPVAERARLHASAAALLRDQRAGPQAIALHLLASTPAGEAEVVAALRAAAAEALARGAPESATRYLRRALDEPPPPELRADVLFELGLAEDRAGDTE